MAEKTEKHEQTLTVPQLREIRRMERGKLSQLLKLRRRTERAYFESIATLESLKEMHGKKEMDVLIPLGAGVMVSGKIDPRTIKRTIPGDVVLNTTTHEIEKELDAVIKRIGTRITEINQEIQSADTSVKSVNTLLNMVRQRAKQDRAKRK